MGRGQIPRIAQLDQCYLCSHFQHPCPMTTGNIPAEALPDLPHNGTVTDPSETDLFHSCWARQICDSCISSRDPCAWCAVSQACVPNIDHGTLLPILAPMRNEKICPLGWQERWELRTKTFGCRCSTMTFMSVVIAVLSSMVGVLLIWAAGKLGRWSVRRWKSRRKGWWKINPVKINVLYLLRWRKEPALQQQQAQDIANTERRPLLG
jgi:hypothetical protein